MIVVEIKPEMRTDEGVMLNDFLLLHKLGVSSSVDNEGVWRNEGLETVGKLWMHCCKTLIRRSGRDELVFC